MKATTLPTPSSAQPPRTLTSGSSTTVYVVVKVAVWPSVSVVFTVNEWLPSVEVSIGVPLATAPTQVETPTP